MINNYAFANELEQFKAKILDPQIKRVDDAWKIMSDIHFPWKDEDTKKLAQAKLDSYMALRDYYQRHYDEGLKIVVQHEALVNTLSKWYDIWYENISNNGKQETELMSMQSDMLQNIFVEIYKALKVLNLDIKPPNALNL